VRPLRCKPFRLLYSKGILREPISMRARWSGKALFLISKNLNCSNLQLARTFSISSDHWWFA